MHLFFFLTSQMFQVGVKFQYQYASFKLLMIDIFLWKFVNNVSQLLLPYDTAGSLGNVLLYFFIRLSIFMPLSPFRKSKDDESYLLDPEKKIKRYDNIMKNTLVDFQSSRNGSDKDNEDSFLTLSANITTFSSTPTVCYFQMVEPNKGQPSVENERQLTLKENWNQSKLKKLLT